MVPVAVKFKCAQAFVSGLAIPLLAGKFGWRSVPYTFAAVSASLGVIWHCWAAETPALWSGPPVMKPAERALFELDTPPPPKAKTAAGGAVRHFPLPFPWPSTAFSLPFP